MTDYNAQGSSIKVGNAASPEVFTAIGDITSIGEFGVTRSRLDVTKLSDTVRKIKSGLISVDDLTIEGTYDPADSQSDGLWTDVTTDNQSDKNYQVSLDTSPVENWTFAAQVTEFKRMGLNVDGLMMFRAVLSINSVPTNA